MNHDLYDRFSDLAAEMPDTDLVDLRGRVDRTSRWLRTRHAIATTAAAVVVGAIVVAGGVALAGRPDQAPLPPSTSASAAPSPTAEPTPSAEPSGTIGTPPAADSLAGTLSYLTLRPGKPIELRRYVDGTLHTVSFGTASAGDVYGQPSPDGTKLVVNTSPSKAQITPGDLVVVEPGGARRTIARDVRWDGGNTAVWTPDGTAVVAAGVRYSVSGGSGTPAGFVQYAPGYLVYSANGGTRAYAKSGTQVEIAEADGSAARTVDIGGLTECQQTAACPSSVQAVSDDGRYVALGNANSDPQHVHSAHIVYDTRDHKRLSLGSFSHAWFPPGGGAVLIAQDTVKVLDASWRTTHTYALPEPIGADTFVWYAR
ncbi:hypothetical protein KZZ52_37285 [Dactylosporangium sp. AC04546]|uniref:hypothetical protein n=1 Tax=Dactylosporangium sp. AC04546 TaxID=2862460 RepID=UPI001EDEC0E0|nr:hypothetical protein [Dactylosporangium sp. AC04546]WVK79621.1 hypothetical protein KZZ52_37285 [Dactylosporangium sp. AC04546]